MNIDYFILTGTQWPNGQNYFFEKESEVESPETLPVMHLSATYCNSLIVGFETDPFTSGPKTFSSALPHGCSMSSMFSGGRREVRPHSSFLC